MSYCKIIGKTSEELSELTSNELKFLLTHNLSDEIKETSNMSEKLGLSNQSIAFNRKKNKLLFLQAKIQFKLAIELEKEGTVNCSIIEQFSSNLQSKYQRVKHLLEME